MNYLFVHPPALGSLEGGTGDLEWDPAAQTARPRGLYHRGVYVLASPYRSSFAERQILLKHTHSTDLRRRSDCSVPFPPSMLDSRFLDRLLTRVFVSVCVPVLRKMWSVKTAKKSQFRQRPTEGRNGCWLLWSVAFLEPSLAQRLRLAGCVQHQVHLEFYGYFGKYLPWWVENVYPKTKELRFSQLHFTVRFQAGARIVVSVSCRFARRRWLQLHWLASWMQHHVLRWWKNISKYFSTIFNTWNLLKKMFCKAKRLF